MRTDIMFCRRSNIYKAFILPNFRELGNCINVYVDKKNCLTTYILRSRGVNWPSWTSPRTKYQGLQNTLRLITNKDIALFSYNLYIIGHSSLGKKLRIFVKSFEKICLPVRLRAGATKIVIHFCAGEEGAISLPDLWPDQGYNHLHPREDSMKLD